MTDGLTDKEKRDYRKAQKDIMTDGITVIEKDSQEKNKYMYRQKRLKRILDVRRERESRVVTFENIYEIQ
jgi:hypothetical protein